MGGDIRNAARDVGRRGGARVIDAEDVQKELLFSAGVAISLDEARELVPLVLAQRAALQRLERFDTAQMRLPVRFDPRAPFQRT